jgi:4-hydroxybenzoate polyprenyltransferase
MAGFSFFSSYIFDFIPTNKKNPFSGKSNGTYGGHTILPYPALLQRLWFEEIENYKGHFAVIFAHASFLFRYREMIKDLENIKAIWRLQNHSILYGEDLSKKSSQA